jgi:predicted dehydrogenase
MPKTRLVFVGVGGMGQCAHLQNYAVLPDCEIVALAELRPQLGKLVAARYGIPRVYQDHRELLAHESFDAIVHIQGYPFHGQTVPDLVKAGKPLITEKPISNSPETGERLAAAAQAAGCRYFVAYHKRSDPGTMWAKAKMAEWTKSGEVGALRYVRLTMPPGDWIANGFAPLLTTSEKAPPTAADPAPAGMSQAEARRYDELVNYYVHQVNLMRHLLGGDYRVVFADKAGRIMAVEGPGGVTGVIEMAPWNNTIDWQEAALVCFERGWIKIELPAPLAHHRPGRVTVYHDPGGGAVPTTTNPQLPFIHAMRQQAANFLSAVRGQTTPLCPTGDAAKDLNTIKEYLNLYLAAGGKV